MGNKSTKPFSYNIVFKSRSAIKSHVLADFIADWIGFSSSNHPDSETFWTIHCDDTWCHAGAGATAVITAPSRAKYKYVECLSFALETDKCNNNIA